MLLCLFLLGASTEKSCSGPPIQKITKEELKAMLGEPGLVIIDVRIGRSWTESDQKIEGAIHEDPEKIDLWASKYANDKKIVLYCA
jgi:rhodanese-related sulfurtransferase